MRYLATFVVFIHLLIAAVSGQECTDTVTVGSLSHDNNTVTLDQTFILAGYTVPCSGTVVAWEFCYQRADITATFYPGIWRIAGTMSGNTEYILVQSNTVTYDQSVHDTQDPANSFPCQIFNLSDIDQFIAPAGSVVGLYSNFGTRLLRTNTNSSITTYQFTGNQSSVSISGNGNDVNHNITIRVHLAVSGQECTDTVTVGSLSHDNNILLLDRTVILAGYTVPCSGTVVAWEFCYQISRQSPVTFYPGIWRITGTISGYTDYALVQSNTVTYDQSVRDPQDTTNLYPCQIFKLSDADQFTAPAGSVVGLYSNVITRLLRTNTDSSVTTYQFVRNQSSVRTTGYDDVNYNIAIRVHLVSISDTVTSVISTTTASDDVPMSNNSGSSSDNFAIIGGVVGAVVGGAILLIIIVVLCIVCIRRSHRKDTFPVNTSIVAMENTVIIDDHIYNSIDSHVSANSDQPSNEGKYGVINQPKSDYVDYETTGDDMKNVHPLCIPNSNQPSNEGEYGVINQPKSDYVDYETTGDDMKNVHPLCIPNSNQPSNEGEYGVINQPKSDYVDYETAGDAKGQIHVADDQSYNTLTAESAKPDGEGEAT